MQNNIGVYALTICLLAHCACGVIYGQPPKLPETLEEKIDALASAMGDGVDAKDYIVQLGPDVVPMVAQKLLNSLAEGASPEGVKTFAIIDMPKADQKRAIYQGGLIGVQSLALQYIPLESPARELAMNSLYRAIESPYIYSRLQVSYAFGNIGDPASAEKMMALLNDSDKFVRVRAAITLSKIGDASIARKIEEILENRRQSLTEEEIAKDASFRHGYAAIEKLREKSSPAPSSAVPSTPVLASTVPQPQTEPVAPEEQSESPTDIPILPIAIITAIIVAAVFLLRRRG